MIKLTIFLLLRFAVGESLEAKSLQHAAKIMASNMTFHHESETGPEQTAIQLAAGLAHDFGNVLTSILGRTEALLGELQPTAPAYSNLQGIQRDAQRATTLIHQLVDFAGGKTHEQIVLDIGEVVFDLAHILIPLLGPKIELTVVREPGLGACLADQHALEMAVMNLVKNARDAMPDGGRVAIVARNAVAGELDIGDYVVLEVFDTGPGMTDDVLARVFDPFFTTKPHGKGSGLGLPNVRSFFRRSGGTIVASRNQSKGSVFRGYLPRIAGEQ
ncbi:MAG: ATP-binding protein [Hyphomicrobium sp.]|nr:ATP-binding protein [Hyphomicrobium sp.]